MLRIAEEGAFTPYWSRDVLDELATVLVREAKLTDERAKRRIQHMTNAFPTSAVEGYASLIDAMTCQKKDRHVLAAAIHARCEVIVTFNVKDFPAESTRAHPITIVTPDGFLLDQIDLHPPVVKRALIGQLTEARRPPLTMGQLLGRLTRAGVPSFADEARRHQFES